MKITGSIFLFILFCFTFSACRKDLYMRDIQPDKFGSLYDYFKHNERSLLQEFLIDTRKDTLLTSRSGAKIFIHKNSFFDFNVNKIYEGNVTVEFRELRTVANLVFANKPTQTQDNILETDGAFSLDIKEKWNLRFSNAPGARSYIMWPPINSLDTAMRLFDSEVTSEPQNFFRWTDSDDSLLYDFRMKQYQVFPEHLKWINIDKLAGLSDPKVKITVSFPSGFDVSNAQSYIIFKNQRSVLSANYKSEFLEMPAGEEVVLVTIGIKNEKMFLGSKSLKLPSSNSIIGIEMQPSNNNSIKLFLDNTVSWD